MAMQSSKKTEQDALAAHYGPLARLIAALVPLSRTSPLLALPASPSALGGKRGSASLPPPAERCPHEEQKILQITKNAGEVENYVGIALTDEQREKLQ